jgi:hypothetical protein
MPRRIVGLVLLAVALLAAPSARAASDLILLFEDDGAPVQGATIDIFLSTGAYTTITDAEGFAIFQIEAGKGFWVEVNGERLDQFFSTDEATHIIDIATIGRMQWPRGR